MPIYEYECPECGCFEAVQKASDKPLKCNPDCENKNCPKKAVRLISASAFHLKGGGWYKTDYSSPSSGGSSTSKKKPAATTDAKPGESKTSDTEKKAAPAKSCGPGCGCH